MKKIQIVLWILILLVAASLSAADAKHKVVLDDPAGDAQEQGDGGPGKDIVKLTIESTGSSLDVTLELADDAAHYLKGHQAGGVAEMNLDTDGDPATGGIAWWNDEAGFEYVVTIRTCIKYEGGHACAGALGGVPEKGYYSSFMVKRYKEGTKQASDTHDDPFWKSPTQPIDGNLVKVSIPYDELGLKPGGTVRMLIREVDGDFRDSYFPIASLTLK